jgi:hypothetical protein
MHGLWRLVVWGSTAATALLIAVLSSRGRHLALDLHCKFVPAVMIGAPLAG